MKKPGDLLSGRYRIVKTLGRGGMGTVYLAAIEALDDKPVAVKELALTQKEEHHDEAVEQFRKEASLLAHLNHPNLVPVTDFFVEDHAAYLVMSFIQGQDLSRRLRQQPDRSLPVDEVVKIFKDLCEVLNYLHKQNPPVLFRDLKPSNIMVDESEALKLIDFGIARRRSEGEATEAFLKGVGTAGFAALEQHSETTSTDQRTDIYALGATLYNLLTGQVPPDAVSRSAGYTNLVPVSEVRPEVPPELCRVVMKCLEIRPERRFQTVRQLQREFFEPLPNLDGPTENLSEDKQILQEDAPATLPTGARGQTESNSEIVDKTTKYVRPDPPEQQVQPSPKKQKQDNIVLLALTLFLTVVFFAALTHFSKDEALDPELLDLRREASTPHTTLDIQTDPSGIQAAAFAGLTFLKSSGLEIELPDKSRLDSYFGSDDESPKDLINALTDYFLSQGFKKPTFDIEGWTQRKQFPEQTPYPTESLLEEALDNPTAVWLQVGFYEKSSGGKLKRVTSRWMTVVGYREDQLYVSDTIPMDSRRPLPLSLRLERLSGKETLEGDVSGLPISGKRQIELVGDMNKPEAIEVALADCLVVLWLEDLERNPNDTKLRTGETPVALPTTYPTVSPSAVPSPAESGAPLPF